MSRTCRNILIAMLIFVSSSHAWKDIAHYISIPVIEGAGIYSSVASLVDAEDTGTKIAAIANLSLIATNTTLGLITAFAPSDSYPKLRKIHRIVGFAVTAAALGLNITASLDEGVENAPRYVSYGYTALTVVPLIMFKF